MGRGLSGLQVWILQQLGSRRRMFVPEICEGFWGWTPMRPLDRVKDEAERVKHSEAVNGDEWHFQIGDLIPWGMRINYFSPSQIGRREYARVMATTSRTLTRLEGRGLVTLYSGGNTYAEITDKGREWLSVNTNDVVRSVNR